MRPSLLDRLHSRDTALYRRWRLDGDDASPDRRLWVVLTHVGGATPSIAIALLPVIFNHSILAPIGWQAGIVLGLSTLVVQVMKRNILRTRPTESHEEALVVVPDRFSFPSGHATAVMSVAFATAADEDWDRPVAARQCYQSDTTTIPQSSAMPWPATTSPG